MRVRCAGAAVLAALVVGCSADGTAEVAGTVTVDGRPAGRGSVAFIPADGKAATAGGEIRDGRYSARVPPGTARVEIRVPKVVGKKKLYDTPDSPYQEVSQEALPKRFNEETELTLEVKAGRNEKNWELTTK